MKRDNLSVRRIKETGALMMIGDGVLALAEPRGHVKLWLEGPKPWRRTMKAFLKRPAMTRAFGLVEIGLGLWLASRQQARWR